MLQPLPAPVRVFDSANSESISSIRCVLSDILPHDNWAVWLGVCNGLRRGDRPVSEVSPGTGRPTGLGGSSQRRDSTTRPGAVASGETSRYHGHAFCPAQARVATGRSGEAYVR